MSNITISEKIENLDSAAAAIGRLVGQAMVSSSEIIRTMDCGLDLSERGRLDVEHDLLVLGSCVANLQHLMVIIAAASDTLKRLKTENTEEDGDGE